LPTINKVKISYIWRKYGFLTDAKHCNRLVVVGTFNAIGIKDTIVTVFVTYDPLAV
jgi:hypothetical protein